MEGRRVRKAQDRQRTVLVGLETDETQGECRRQAQQPGSPETLMPLGPKEHSLDSLKAPRALQERARPHHRLLFNAAESSTPAGAA